VFGAANGVSLYLEDYNSERKPLMAVEEVALGRTCAVPEANKDSTLGEIHKIRMQALAEETTARVDISRAETSERSSTPKGGSGNGAEAQLYTDLAMEASGLKLASMAVEFIGERRGDMALAGLDLKSLGNKSGGASTGENVRSMEQDIQLAGRGAGIYNAPTGKGAGGASLIERANLAKSSLSDQPAKCHKTCGDSFDQKKMANTTLVKQLCFGNRIASERALASTYAAEQHYQAAMRQAQLMAPGLSLSSGPPIRTAQLLSEAKRYDEEGRA
jgi:hypothetical protein